MDRAKCTHCGSVHFVYQDEVPTPKSMIYCNGCGRPMAEWGVIAAAVDKASDERGAHVGFNVQHGCPPPNGFKPPAGLPIPSHLLR